MLHRKKLIAKFFVQGSISFGANVVAPADQTDWMHEFQQPLPHIQE